MGDSANSVSSRELHRLVGSSFCPHIFDVRREQAYAQARTLFRPPGGGSIEALAPGAPNFRAEPRLSSTASTVIKVSQAASTLLRAMGLRARYLEGGIEAYRALGGPLLRKDARPGRRRTGQVAG